MTHHVLRVHEGATPQDSPRARIEIEYPEYRVTATLFKNGRVYQPGDTIRLHPDTAARFRELGEVADL